MAGWKRPFFSPVIVLSASDLIPGSRMTWLMMLSSSSCLMYSLYFATKT